ncbi:MAG: hypothetical protein H3C31_10030 [Brumimicrobium sp.]|nr:hypothetical protein [Brumimicrobium sp.]MCO5269593.1 hypothetical protein [Brumimicrobium sp.]
MRKFATLISWVFLPLFTPIYALLIALFLPVYANSYRSAESLFYMPFIAKMLFIILFFAFIVIAPGISFAMLKMNKTISSFSMENREERNTPILITGLYCFILFFFLQFQSKQIWIPAILNSMVLGGALAALVAAVINRRMKISLHAIGMGAFFGFFYMYSTQLEEIPYLILIISILLGGIVLSARLALNSHDLKEIGWGYLLGFASQILTIYFYPLIINRI